MAEPREIELKLDVPADRAGKLAHHPPLKGIKPGKSKNLRSTYFDTPKGKLRRHGLSLRVRRVDGRYVQTVKRRRSRGVGLFDRNEWETEIDGASPDLDAARSTALGPLLNKKLRRKLRPQFETDIHRTVYPVRRGDTAVEVAVDKGSVKRDGKSSPLCEVELELKDGPPDGLFALARSIEAVVPAAPASKTKAAHGYDLVAGAEPAPVKAEAISLAADTNWAAAFKIIGRSCLYQAAANEPAVRRGDAEGVHQMRIGLRRLRAAMSLFKRMLAGTQTEAIKTELKWLAEELGPARELDVFIKRVVKRAGNGDGHRRGRGSVAADFRQQRAAALDQAQTAVTSARFRRLVLDAAEWIETGDWTRNDADNRPALRSRSAAKAAAEELRRRRKKIRKQGRKLAELDGRHRHKLRIRAKKLRYAAEFFESLFAGKKPARRRKKFVARLKAVQGALGDLNDIVVNQGLARRAIAPHRHHPRKRRAARARKAFAAGHLSGREAARFVASMHGARRAYKAFAATAAFWR